MGANTVLKDAALEMKQTAYGVGQEWGGGAGGQATAQAVSGKFVIILFYRRPLLFSFVF